VTPAVRVLPYDPEARVIFGEIARALGGMLPATVRIEHVGSTAVKGLGGKGIIDCLVVTAPGEAGTACAVLRQGGFSHNREVHPEDDRWYASGDFVRPSGERLHTHIHITPAGSQCERDVLGFRDYLRQHPEEAREYLRLKHEWSAEAGPEAARYTELKLPYVQSVLAKIAAEAAPTTGE